jgi:hypothetical protein
MQVELDRRAPTRKKEPLLSYTGEIGNILLGPAWGSAQHAGRRSTNVMSAQHIARLRLDKRLAIQNVVSVEEPAASLNQILESQIEWAVKVPEVGALQAIECVDRIGHSSLNPVSARNSLRCCSLTPANAICRVSRSKHGSSPLQRARPRAIMPGG